MEVTAWAGLTVYYSNHNEHRTILNPLTEYITYNVIMWMS